MMNLISEIIVSMNTKPANGFAFDRAYQPNWYNHTIQGGFKTES